MMFCLFLFDLFVLLYVSIFFVFCIFSFHGMFSKTSGILFVLIHSFASVFSMPSAIFRILVKIKKRTI